MVTRALSRGRDDMGCEAVCEVVREVVQRRKSRLGVAPREGLFLLDVLPIK